MQDFLDLDTKKKIHYVSESSNTSGYSTMSPGPNNGYINIVGNQSPSSSNFSASSSPVQSPASLLQSEFSQLTLPSSTVGSMTPIRQFANLGSMSTFNNNFAGFTNTSNAVSMLPQHQYMIASTPHSIKTQSNRNADKYTAVLRIVEPPVEKFRFRYKSEMHGTHGSLNGTNSKRSPKTFPEVELQNYNGNAIIRCSLFQTNLDSPHSHQLVVRNEDVDICDPHDVKVSPELGFVAQFQNMGIIHTAKKYIFDELLKKKLNRLQFEVGHSNLSTKQMQELHKETDKEAKAMDLNQVRLCFEAFKIEEDNTWTRISAPIYTNPINNRKSAQTGELRICRLSIATGSVAGGDDLILLVEKVSKKNIKVRFYETNETDAVVWEAFGKFRESDVHHQYAIVCQTPPYKNKDIDKTIEVFIELVRPSDGECSLPVTFRYKPRDAVASRKRRRTCSSATSSSGSGCSLSSFELPKPLQDQITSMATPIPTPTNDYSSPYSKTISEEFNKDNVLQNLIGSEEFRELIDANSEDLKKFCTQNESVFDIEGDLNALNCLQADGILEADGGNSSSPSAISLTRAAIESAMLKKTTHLKPNINYFIKIFKTYEEFRSLRNQTEDQRNYAAKRICDLYDEYIKQDEYNDTLIHEIIRKDNPKLAMKLFNIIDSLHVENICNRVNVNGQNGLHYACLSDRAHYIRPLLRRGCDPNAQDQHGNTPLHVAVVEQRRKCIESFFNVENLSLNLTIKNDKGRTALHEAITYLPDIAAKLLGQDKSLAFVIDNKNGHNALHMAVSTQNLTLVKLIVNEQEDNERILKARNSAGHTAFDLCKNLKSKDRDLIFEFLEQRCREVDESLVIKLEEMSSSSGDEDEDSSSVEPVEPLELITTKKDTFKNVPAETKNKPIDKDDIQCVSNNDNCEVQTKLSRLLYDDDLLNKIEGLIKVNDKWIQVAEELNLKHFVFLWQNARTMLLYFRVNTHSIKLKEFLGALNKVDPKIAELVHE